MTRGDWRTVENIDFVKKHYPIGHTKEWIAAQIGVSEGAIARLIILKGIRRIDGVRSDAVKGTPKAPITDFWKGGVAPAWRTKEADEWFAIFWNGNVTAPSIREFFDINSEQCRFARLRLNLEARGPSQLPEGTGPVKFGTPMGDIEFRVRWERGDKERDIRGWFGVGRTSFQARKLALALTPRVSAASIDRRVATRKTPVAERVVAPKSPPKSPVNRPVIMQVGGKSPVFSALKWSVATLPKIERRPGFCSWPLTCDAAASGRWCADHAGLLKAHR